MFNKLKMDSEKKSGRFEFVISIIAIILTVISFAVSITVPLLNSFPQDEHLFIFITSLVIAVFICIILIRYVIVAQKDKSIKKYVYIGFFLAILPFMIFIIIEYFFAKRLLNILLINRDQWINIFGAGLAYIGTCFLGLLALYQGDKANKVSERLLYLEEMRSAPFLHIDISQSDISTFNEHEIDISIAFRNETDAIVNITDVSNLLYGRDKKVSFCKSWTNHYSVLPHQSRQMNFFIENKMDEPKLIEYMIKEKDACMYQMQCKFEIKIHFVNSQDIYKQQYEFFIHVAKKDGERKPTFTFTDIENSIIKEEQNNG